MDIEDVLKLCKQQTDYRKELWIKAFVAAFEIESVSVYGASNSANEAVILFDEAFRE